MSGPPALSLAQSSLEPPRGSLALSERFLGATKSGARIAALVDPDRTGPDEALALARVLEDAGFDIILFGTSVSHMRRETEVARAIHRATSLPVILFPGSADQLTPHADALLFLSLISGRNPRYLIEEQVRAAARVRELRLPAIPTAYILVEGGRVSTVERVTETAPIAANAVKSLVDHAVAAELLGMRAIYLEAGSGAARCVPAEALRAVREATRVPIIAGGGIRTPEACAALAAAGADTLVVGTLIEEGTDASRLRALASAAHGSANAAAAESAIASELLDRVENPIVD